MGFAVAIDGPAGAGKSTIAKLVAKELNFIYVDTGAMYRAMGLKCLRTCTDISVEEDVVKVCNNTDVSIRYENNEQVIILDGTNVNGFIRTNEVGNAASTVSAYKDVRTKLVSLQRELAEKESVVMDGRDIASCVLPNADVKIYLDASVSCRAQRRYEEYINKGQTVNYEEIKKDIIDRDYQDMNRSNSPLIRVPEAIYIDSSDLTINRVCEMIISECKEKLNA